MKKPGINEFHDVNKFPRSPGIFYFALSMPLLNNVQHPKELYAADEHIISKICVSNTGVQVVYTDNLYLYSDEPAADLKLKHQKMIEVHKQGWLKLIKQNVYMVPKAFTFMTWNQLQLDCPNFTEYLAEFRRICDRDEKLRSYIAADIEGTGRNVTRNSIGYMLEEILLDYLVMKGHVRLRNDYTLDREEWILNTYHGKPHRSHVHLHQQNYFQLDNPRNIFQNSWYDVLNRRLYDFDRLDIETFDFNKRSTAASRLKDEVDVDVATPADSEGRESCEHGMMDNKTLQRTPEDGRR
jgi:hypothetical protein